jgi:uncharacterized protein YjdB
MAVCNLFESLNKNTGTFLMFSQYTEDITKMSSQPGSYKVVPSKFIALDISYEGYNNESLVKNIQSQFENGCAYYREQKSSDWYPWKSSYIFWRTLYNMGLINIQEYVEDNNGERTSHEIVSESRYVGDINIQSYDEYSGMGYAETYCYIPSDGVKQYLKLSIPYSENDTLDFNGYELIGTNIATNPMLYNYSSIDCEYKTVELSDKDFTFNTIVVLYDILYIDGEGNVKNIYSNIPMGIYFTGLIQMGVMQNNVIKYVSNNDIYGSGTSYGLRICSRFISAPNNDIINVDTTVENNNYSSICKVMSAFASTQEKVNDVVDNAYKDFQSIKETLAIFKNSRTNVPYIKKVGNEPYWFVNGRNTGYKACEKSESDSNIEELDYNDLKEILKIEWGGITFIDIKNDDMKLNVGDSCKLSISYSPDDIDNPSFIWSSSDPSIVSVNSDGVITVLKYIDNTPITIKVMDAQNTDVYDTVNITVNEPPVEIPIQSIEDNTGSNSYEMIIGDTKQLGVKYNPSDTTQKGVKWSSSDTSIATVSNNGLVTAKGVNEEESGTNQMGSATIIATSEYNSNISTSWHITTSHRLLTGLSISGEDDLTLVEGDVLNIGFSKAPSNATRYNIIVESSQSDVVEAELINNMIKISALKYSEEPVTVTITDLYTTVTDSIIIHVKEYVEPEKDYIYIGGLEPEGEVTEEMVKKLNKIETTKPLDVISFTYETGRMCYAYPTKWPEISSMTDPNGFGFIFDAQSNMIIDGTEYRVYYEPDGVDSQSDFKLNVKY